jgi:ankyrin repeat protein
MKKIYILFLVLLLALCQSVQAQKIAAADDELELCKAAYYGELERVKTLLESGADVNAWRSLGSHDHTPLMYAVYMGHFELAKILIEAGADINAAHSTDHTVLYHALESPQLRTEVIQLLVDAGVNMDHTPLIWAIKNNSSKVPEIMPMLIEAGADVNARDKFSTTALILVVKYRKKQLVDTLLCSGAEINAADGSGSTALAWAVTKKDIKMVKQLIDVGADLEMADNWGNTPLMIAKSNGSEEIVKLLKDAGAKK